MIDEAVAHDLQINQNLYERIVLGTALPGAERRYVAPDPDAPPHNSMTLGWNLLEIIPKRAKWRETRTWSLLTFYLPLGERR